MQSNDTLLSHRQSITTIVWNGDYPAAQQLASGITDINCHPDPGAMSAIAGRKITFDRASGMLRGAK